MKTKTKKKVITSAEVQFSAKSSDDQKKVFMSADVAFSLKISVKTKKRPLLFVMRPGLEIDNEKVENNSITQKKSREFQYSIKKIKSRDYRSIDNGKSILFTDSVNSDGVNLF